MQILKFLTAFFIEIFASINLIFTIKNSIEWIWIIFMSFELVHDNKFILLFLKRQDEKLSNAYRFFIFYWLRHNYLFWKFIVCSFSNLHILISFFISIVLIFNLWRFWCYTFFRKQIQKFLKRNNREIISINWRIFEYWENFWNSIYTWSALNESKRVDRSRESRSFNCRQYLSFVHKWEKSFELTQFFFSHSSMIS